MVFGCVYNVQGTTKEEFVAITIYVEIHCHHLYFVHHVTKVTKVVIA